MPQRLVDDAMDDFYDNQEVGDQNNGNTGATMVDRQQLVPGFSGRSIVKESFSFLEDDPGRMKTTWAGVEHWKIKRVTCNSSKQGNAPMAPKGGRAKKCFDIDFESAEVDLAQLLAKGTNLCNVQNDNNATTTLPDDLHISSSMFTRLFLKSAWEFGETTVYTAEGGRRAANTADALGPHLMKDEGDVVAAIPVAVGEETHYEEDYHHHENNAMEDIVDLSQALFKLDPSQPKMSVNFSKRAKRVDVHLLKECILSTTAGSKSVQFSNIISHLPQQYPNCQEVSVQYAFICLLHLANEHGLCISEQPNGDLLVSSASST
jgi:condensin complex subunit 2